MLRTLILASAAALALAGCAQKQAPIAEAPPAPPPAPVLPAGAVAGTVAADRDGDGLIDGYYTPDGVYHPAVAPQPMAPPPTFARSGERG